MTDIRVFYEPNRKKCHRQWSVAHDAGGLFRVTASDLLYKTGVQYTTHAYSGTGRMTACTRPYELTVDGDVRRQSVVTVDVVQ